MLAAVGTGQGKWAEEEHLRGSKCSSRRERFNVVMSPFLAQLLANGAAKAEASPLLLQIISGAESLQVLCNMRYLHGFASNYRAS